MKKLYSILGFMILLISPFQQLFAQSSTCATSTPFCTGSPITYPAVTGVASSGSYQCLSSMPNPTWFFLEMQTPGAVDIDLTGGADIDFALWGPYAPGTNLSTVCPTIFSSAANMIDCSFSASAYEQANIPAGAGNVAGAIYVLLITNYSGSAINITVDQVSGSGVTNCGIVPPCSLSLTCAANVSANSLPCGTSGNVTVPAPTVNYLSGTCGIATLTNSFNGTSNASGLYPVGTTTVTWTATSPVNGATATCTQTVTVTAAGLTSPTVSNASVCSSSPVTLTASGAGGCSGSIEWYTAATGGTAFYTGSSYTFTPVTTTTYYVQENKSTTGGTD